MRNNDQWHPATLRAHRDLTPTVREFELRPEGGVKPWSVGSHLDVQVAVGDRLETRSYSLVGLPDAEVYRIAVKRAEPGRGGSRWMWGLQTGDELRIGEPNNHFELALGAPQYLIVAGGIGITPLVGMAATLAQRGAELRMLYAARSDAEFAYRDRLRESLGERLALYADDAGQRIDLDAEIARLHPQARLLVCGPIPMLDAAKAAWQRAGRPPAELHFETFGSSGAHAAESFWVRIPRHGLELQVPADRSLLDVLEQAGVETLYDCRRGECGLCAMDIVSLTGTVDHRDVFFSAEEKRQDRRLCTCVSRISGGGVVLDSSYRPDA